MNLLWRKKIRPTCVEVHKTDTCVITYLGKRILELEKALEDAIAELSSYAQGRRDQSFEGWEKTWKEIPIKNEFDYEYYPNHVDVETIEELKKVLGK
jgi:hypothetical protein